MANYSDAFGTIKVEKIGKEFLEFLVAVQGENTDAYYTLVDRADISESMHAVDENNNLEMTFSTFGRWSYGSNIDGYLRGTWLQNYDKEAYNELIDALISNDGSVTVEYTDSDVAMGWMGTGKFTMVVSGGEVKFSDDWQEKTITVLGFSELYGYTEYEALERLHGDEVAEKFEKYLKECDDEPLSADKWLTLVYKEE